MSLNWTITSALSSGHTGMLKVTSKVHIKPLVLEPEWVGSIVTVHAAWAMTADSISTHRGALWSYMPRIVIPVGDG